MNSIIYNSGLNIWNPLELGTFCIFYDEVYLPSTTDQTRGICIALSRRERSNGKYVIEGIDEEICFDYENDRNVHTDVFAREWEQRNGLLFKEGVLKRLPPGNSARSKMLDVGMTIDVEEMLLEIPMVLRARSDGTERVFLWRDHVQHLFRTDLKLPGIFICRGKRSREALKGLMALRAFRFTLPRIAELKAEEIMEVRKAVADTREGFSMHLQRLSKEVETRIKGGESLVEVARHAEMIVETQLLPDYYEFRRQLAAKRSGFWKGILEKTGKILEIDVSPMTPKFYYEVLKALGFGFLGTVDEQKERLSNASQAYQFLRQVERR